MLRRHENTTQRWLLRIIFICIVAVYCLRVGFYAPVSQVVEKQVERQALKEEETKNEKKIHLEKIGNSGGDGIDHYTEDDIHIVFSTSCNYFQHWQSEVLLYSHLKVRQRGKITRVVSGCDKESQRLEDVKYWKHPENLAHELVPLEELKKSSNPNLRLHVTPSFPGAKEFPWINKPMGLLHWLEHANPPVKEKIIVVLDPDEFFMDKLVIDGSHSVEGDGIPYGKKGILVTLGAAHGQIFGNKSVIGIRDIVKLGRPIGQTYGFGGIFVQQYNISEIVEPDSPALNLTKERAAQHYSVGPPLIGRIEDMKMIFTKWAKYMLPVFKQKPGYILTDMYAYSLAAAHYNLNHLSFNQYMVSNAESSNEAWPFVNKFGEMSCSNPNKNAHEPDARIPTFLHATQRSDSNNTAFMFHKGHVPPNILSCDLPILVSPPDDLIQTAPSIRDKQKMYILCNAYNLINEAVLAWKKKFCAPGYNTKEQIMLLKKSQQCAKELQGKSCWIYATKLENAIHDLMRP